MTITKLMPRAALTTLAALTIAAVLAACGGSSSSSSTSASASNGSGNSRTALAACLRKHGLTLPAGRGPGTGGSGAPPSGSGAPPAGGPPSGLPGGGAGSSKFRAALKACGANFPAGRGPAGFNRQAIQKYVSCVRSHGYDLPNPNFSGNGPVFPSNTRSNAKFQTASKACQSLLTPAQGSGA